MTTPGTTGLSFERLVAVIGQAHEDLAAQASRAVNASLTLRNWLIGLHIEEYERRGVDRQQYGEKLLDRLAESLIQKGVSRCDRRELYRYRQFFLTYPQIRESLPPQSVSHLGGAAAGLTPGHRIVESATPQSRVDGQTLLARLSFTHFVELIAVEDDTKRAFYEAECLRGNWSVRELKRQIASLYYERSGLSKEKRKLATLAQQGAEHAESKLDIRDPYVFEFLREGIFLRVFRHLRAGGEGQQYSPIVMRRMSSSTIRIATSTATASARTIRSSIWMKALNKPTARNILWPVC